MTSRLAAAILMIFPKLYQPEKIITEIEWSVAVDLFLEWANATASAAPALIRHCLEQGKKG